MQAYKAYFEGGRVVPLGNPAIPEGSELIITVLEESPDDVARRQKAALAQFRESVRSSDPLPPEFDEIMNQRVNFTRELDL